MAEKDLLLAGQTSFTTLVPYAVEIPLVSVTGFSWPIPDNCVAFDLSVPQISATLDANLTVNLLRESDAAASVADYTSLNQEGSVTSGSVGTATLGWGSLPVSSSGNSGFFSQVRSPRSTSIKTFGFINRLSFGTIDRIGFMSNFAQTAEDHNVFRAQVSTGFITGTAHIYYTVEETVTI